MERLNVDKQGRMIIEKGLIRIYTDDLAPDKTMLIIDFVKFVLNNSGGKILPFPTAQSSIDGFS